MFTRSENSRMPFTMGNLQPSTAESSAFDDLDWDENIRQGVQRDGASESKKQAINVFEQAINMITRPPGPVPTAEIELPPTLPTLPIEPSTTSSDVSALLLSQTPAMLAHMAALRLNDESAEVRLASIEVLSKAPEVLREHARVLSRLLDDEAWFVRRAAVSALARLEPPLPAKQAADCFMPRLGDAKDEIRAMVLQRLCKIDATVLSDFAGAITRATRDPFWAARAAACSALGKLTPESVQPHGGVQAVVGRLSDSAAGVRLAAIQTLEVWDGAVLCAHQDALMRIALDEAESTEVRCAAEQCLSRIRNRGSASGGEEAGASVNG